MLTLIVAVRFCTPKRKNKIEDKWDRAVNERISITHAVRLVVSDSVQWTLLTERTQYSSLSFSFSHRKRKNKCSPSIVLTDWTIRACARTHITIKNCVDNVWCVRANMTHRKHLTKSICPETTDNHFVWNNFHVHVAQFFLGHRTMWLVLSINSNASLKLNICSRFWLAASRFFGFFSSSHLILDEVQENRYCRSGFSRVRMCNCK